MDSVAGGMAGLVTALIVCPFDIVKFRLQNEAKPIRTRQIISSIYNEQGVFGLYRGLSLSIQH
jgi:hypothetical protein